MLSKVSTFAVTALSAFLIGGSPVLAESYVIQSDGWLVDSAGTRIKQFTVTASTTRLVAPVEVPLSGCGKVLGASLTTTAIEPVVDLSEATSVVGAPIERRVITESAIFPVESFVVDSLAEALLNVLDERRLVLEDRLAFIEPEQSFVLRTQLAQVEAVENSAQADGKLTYDKAIAIASDLDLLSNQAFMITQRNRLSPLVTISPAGNKEIALGSMPIF